MSTQQHIRVPMKPSLTPAPSGLLQRQCACDNHTVAGVSVLSAAKKDFFEPRFGHDFSQVRVHTDEKAVESASAVNGLTDDPIHRPLIEQFRRREGLPPGGVDEFGQPVGPSEAEIKYTGLALQCPFRTQVESIIDMTPAGLAAGYLSAYGALAKMRVSDERTWDGTRIVESLKAGPNTCPAGLTHPGPCTGGSTFTVGSPSGGSAILPAQPGLRNRFYDFHTSRSKTVSFLHDRTRNPTSMDSCKNVCNQEYLCDGVVIGRHTITRTFRKGKHAGKDVTIIDVTKT